MTRINFSLGAPFAPFEQLLAVLPSGAREQHVVTHPQRRADARVARSQRRRRCCRSRTGGSCLTPPGELAASALALR
jgi:hypothetical protein